MNLVYRHPSGGRLYQGNFKDAINVPGLDEAGIKTVVFAAREKNSTHLPDRFDVIRAQIDDNPFPGSGEAHDMWRCADRVSDLLVIYLANGVNTLSSCAAGKNRSGLMSGFTLVKLGIPAEQAIAMIRRARNPFALSNPAFARMITRFAKRRAQGVAS